MAKTPPRVTSSDEGEGTPLNRYGSKALKMIQNNELMPYWEMFTGAPESRLALERWGMAEFKKLKPMTSSSKAHYMARLTPAGIKARDDYARYKAERASKRRHGR